LVHYVNDPAVLFIRLAARTVEKAPLQSSSTGFGLPTYCRETIFRLRLLKRYRKLLVATWFARAVLWSTVGTQPILDLEGLLSPIDDASPCGSDPRLDPSPVSTYQTLKDARHAAADAERNIERGFAEERDAKAAEETAKRSWDLIFLRGPPLIANDAKDLEVAAWLTEALLRMHQLAGLRDGLLLIIELVERYWDDVFPLPDEDGLETRLIPIIGLSGGEADGRLIAPLKRVRLTEGDDPPPFLFWQYESAAAGNADGGATIAAFMASLQRSSEQFLRDLADDARACIGALARIDAALETRCGTEAPSFSRVRAVLSGVLDALGVHGAVVLDAAPPLPNVTLEASSEMPVEQTGGVPIEPTRSASLDRQGALRQLEELAIFFRRTEPHSPLAYAIDNLVRRGRMTFSELVEELIDDGNARKSYLVNAGIQPPPDGTRGS
jgi:type VI secretion system protein ImpA